MVALDDSIEEWLWTCKGDDITAMVVKWNVNVKVRMCLSHSRCLALEGMKRVINAVRFWQGTDSNDNHEFTLIRPQTLECIPHEITGTQLIALQ